MLRRKRETQTTRSNGRGGGRRVALIARKGWFLCLKKRLRHEDIEQKKGEKKGNHVRCGGKGRRPCPGDAKTRRLKMTKGKKGRCVLTSPGGEENPVGRKKKNFADPRKKEEIAAHISEKAVGGGDSTEMGGKKEGTNTRPLSL